MFDMFCRRKTQTTPAPTSQPYIAMYPMISVVSSHIFPGKKHIISWILLGEIPHLQLVKSHSASFISFISHSCNRLYNTIPKWVGYYIIVPICPNNIQVGGQKTPSETCLSWDEIIPNNKGENNKMFQTTSILRKAHHSKAQLLFTSLRRLHFGPALLAPENAWEPLATDGGSIQLI